MLAVPGNHDIPALPPRRFLRTFAEFERVWGETEPVYRSETLVACGLDSVRPWLYQEGVVQQTQLERIAGRFASASPGAVRVAVLHHHLVSAPWRTAKRPLFRRARVLAALAAAGAEVVLSGHVHQSTVVECREFEVASGPLATMVVVTAPGLGRPRPRRRGEACGLQVVEAEPDALSVLTYALSGERFAPVAARRYPRSSSPSA